MGKRMILAKRIQIDRPTCDGIYLRWWFNGWHYFHFINSLEYEMKTNVVDTMTTRVFSSISRVQRPTKIESEYAYNVQLDGIAIGEIDGFANILIAERVEQFDTDKWYEVDITRGEKVLRDGQSPAYSIEFEVTRKELPNTPAVFQKSQFLWIGNTLADLDDGEVIAMNKQVNNIAELQDRQTDFTASFKIRKTRAMRDLFELTGDVASTTAFPYELQTCKLVVDGIELITGGRLVVLKSDEQYYHVSIYSGNINFFDITGKLKLTDLNLDDLNFNWNWFTVSGCVDGSKDYLFPLVEPSDDGGVIPLNTIGSECTIDGALIWPFIRVSKIWNQIFTSAGYTAAGNILNNLKFKALWMPIVNRAAGDVSKFMYSLYNNTTIKWTESQNVIHSTANVIINGSADIYWKNYGIFVAHYSAKHKFRMYVIWNQAYESAPNIGAWMWFDGGYVEMTKTEEQTDGNKKTTVYVGELDMTGGQTMQFAVNAVRTFYFDLSCTSIEKPLIGYGSDVTPALNLPQFTQSDFIKSICNMFALVPECDPRTRIVTFWNYNELYYNVLAARDWSKYLSEMGDEMEFKFGDYAQQNFMKYKDTDDVIPANGTGMMQLADETLPDTKDMIAVPFSYADEVLIFSTNENVSRIAMNKYDSKNDEYVANEKIEPRILYGSVLTGKTMKLSVPDIPTTIDVANPIKMSSIEVSFGSLGVNYAPLANMLYKTKLVTAKFNLPVYEVAQFKHNVPIFLSQFHSYFYVNKIKNYVAGKLTSIELIKL